MAASGLASPRFRLRRVPRLRPAHSRLRSNPHQHAQTPNSSPLKIAPHPPTRTLLVFPAMAALRSPSTHGGHPHTKFPFCRCSSSVLAPHAHRSSYVFLLPPACQFTTVTFMRPLACLFDIDESSLHLQLRWTSAVCVECYRPGGREKGRSPLQSLRCEELWAKYATK